MGRFTENDVVGTFRFGIGLLNNVIAAGLSDAFYFEKASSFISHKYLTS